MGQTLSVAFNRQAQILEVSRAQEVVEWLQKTLGQAAPTLEQVAAQVRVEWNANYGNFWAHVADHPAILGGPWESTEMITAFFPPELHTPFR